MPEISIIMPTYNREKFIAEAISSVLNQTYSDYELIIVDDGSTDNTGQVVASFASPKIRYVPLEHQGRSRARNHALSLAQGQYIAFLDSDDQFLPNKLEFQMYCMKNEPEIDMVYSSAITVDEKGEFLSFYFKANSTGMIYYDVVFFYPQIMFPSTWLLRAKILQDVGLFDEHLDRYEDIDFCRRVARKFNIQGIFQPLLKFRAHPETSMKVQDPKVILDNMDYYVDKVFQEDKNMDQRRMRKAAALFYRNYGEAVARHPQFRTTARKFFLRSLRYWPFFPQTYQDLIIS